MSERVTLTRGGAIIRVVPENVSTYEAAGFARKENPTPKRRGRPRKTAGDE